MFIVSSTGKVQQMEITDTSKSFILIHPIKNKNLNDFGLTDEELYNSVIIKGLIQDGSLIKYYDPDKFNQYTEEDFPLMPVIPIQEIINETEEPNTEIAKPFRATLTSGQSTYNISHNLGKSIVTVLIKDISTKKEVTGVICTFTDSNTISLDFGVNTSTNHEIIVIG